MRPLVPGIGVAVTAALLAGCAGPSTPGRTGAGSLGSPVKTEPAPTVARGEPRPLTVRITLERTTVVRGRPISGEAIVRNSTGHDLVIADCNGGWLQTGLTNAAIGYDPAWLACLSVPGTILRAGTTRLPITVRTTYGRCTPHAAAATAAMPACLRDGSRTVMPPLPPGNYRTKVVMLTPKGVRIPSPPSIEVTLTR